MTVLSHINSKLLCLQRCKTTLCDDFMNRTKASRNVANETPVPSGGPITRFIDRCDTCRRNRPTQREQPLRPVELPGRPWGKVAMDIFHYKRNDYLVIIDYYSRWIEIKQLTSLTSDCVISRVKTYLPRMVFRM